MMSKNMTKMKGIMHIYSIHLKVTWVSWGCSTKYLLMSECRIYITYTSQLSHVYMTGTVTGERRRTTVRAAVRAAGVSDAAGQGQAEPQEECLITQHICKPKNSSPSVT